MTYTIVNFLKENVEGLTDLSKEIEKIKSFKLSNYSKANRASINEISTMVENLNKSNDSYFIVGYEKFLDSERILILDSFPNNLFFIFTKNSDSLFLINKKVKKYLEEFNSCLYIEKRDDISFIKEVSDEMNFNGIFINPNKIKEFSEIEIDWMKTKFGKVNLLGKDLPKVDNIEFQPPSVELLELMKKFDEYLKTQEGI